MLIRGWRVTPGFPTTPDKKIPKRNRQSNAPEARPPGRVCDGYRRLLAFHFFQASRLASQAAKVKQLGAADPCGPHLLHFVDHLGVEGEDALDALAEAHLTHREAALCSILERNHNAFECLQAFFVAFFDLDLHPYRIAGHELGQVGAPKLVGETLHNWMNRHSLLPDRDEKARLRRSS